MTHISVSKLTIIGSDNGLSPDRRQAIIWTNAGILLIWTLGTNFTEISSEIHAFSFKKMHLKMSSAKWRPFCLGLNVLNCVMFFFSFRALKWVYLLTLNHGSVSWQSCQNITTSYVFCAMLLEYVGFWPSHINHLMLKRTSLRMRYCLVRTHHRGSSQ